MCPLIQKRVFLDDCGEKTGGGPHLYKLSSRTKKKVPSSLTMRSFATTPFNATTSRASSSSSTSLSSTSSSSFRRRGLFHSTTQKKKKKGSPPARGFALPAKATLGPELKTQIDKCVSENKVVLFMKGTKSAPRCGFSNTCVQILESMDVPFTDVDILASEQLRAGMKTYSNWPTFPQLYISGEFFGGCDITMDAYKDGSLKEELERAMLE